MYRINHIRKQEKGTKVKIKTAHITKTGSEIIAQDLKEHLTHAAVLCREYTRKVGCPAMGYIVGILHDTGKAASAFRNRMDAIREGRPDPGQKGGHASAGAVILNRIGGRPDAVYKSFALQAMCEAIFSHHAALPDNISMEGEDGYKTRLQCDETQLREIEAYLWEEVITREDLTRHLRQAYTEAEALYRKIKEHTEDGRELSFFLGMVEKLLLSALIDADWLDSAISGERVQPDFKDVLKTETEDTQGDRKRLFEYFLDNLEKGLKKMGRSSKPINVWRNYISDSCKEAGSREGGIYTLSCPTGAGKTLAVTRFAITHCIRRNKDRIFYIIPYLSILDQTAKSIKTALAQESSGISDGLVENNILELHSQAEGRKGKGQVEKQSGERAELSSDGEFWAQRMAEPIVLTTMVRFLNTFFSQGTRNLRPAHQFQNAVIIFDEIQTLPIKQIALFNSLINFLTYICGCTCVLCTATQPLLGETEKPVYPVRLAEPAALAELPGEAGEVFKRVQVKAELKNGGYTGEELADFIWEKAERGGNALAILNTRDSALAIYNELAERAGEEYEVFYLSTRLYAAHRKNIIDDIRKALSGREKIIVVSTPLVEAGLDFDFSCVVRSLAGMDSIVQAAGRCNREGLRGVETTYIVNPCDELESLARLKDIREGAQASYRLLEEYERDPESFACALLSQKAMHTYFQYYFWMRKGEMTYPVSEVSADSLYSLLADNASLVKSGKTHKRYEVKALNQSFRTAAELFSVIEDGGDSVFVPRGRGKEIWEEIQMKKKDRNTGYQEIKSLLKETQQFVVNLQKYEIEELGKGVIRWEDEMGMYILNEMYYDEKTGLTGEISDNMPFYGF